MNDTRLPSAPEALTSFVPLLLSAPEAAALCSVSPATWHRWQSAGCCPAPVRPSPGCVRWRSEELREWVRAGCPSRAEFEARQKARTGDR